MGELLGKTKSCSKFFVGCTCYCSSQSVDVEHYICKSTWVPKRGESSCEIISSPQWSLKDIHVHTYTYRFRHLQFQFLQTSLVSVKAQLKLVRRTHTTGSWKSKVLISCILLCLSNPPFHRRIWILKKSIAVVVLEKHCSRHSICINWNIFEVWDNLNSRCNVAEKGSWKAVGQTGEKTQQSDFLHLLGPASAKASMYLCQGRARLNTF